MSIVAVVGSGMMGSALCVPLVDRGHSVRLVGTHLDGNIVTSLKNSGYHPTLKLTLPREIYPFFDHELDAALSGIELLILGVSSQGVRWAAQRLGKYLTSELPVVMVAKGLSFDGTALRILPDVFGESLHGAVPRVSPVAIAGPCIAGELARRIPTAVVLAGRDARFVERAAIALENQYYRVWPARDVVGTEVCAALKNAYAMGIAFASGLHEQRGGQPGSVAMHNYESAVFAQASFEMQRIVQLLGGEPATVGWLPGIGDLDVTCNGGRTGRFGYLLGLGLGLAEAKARMAGATLECLEILEVLSDALSTLQAGGGLASGELPLLRHLIDVGLHGAPIAVPFERFFARADV